MATEGERWLLCAAGEWPSLPIVDSLARQAAVTIGIDEGTDRAVERGLTVNHICGDLDSIAQIIGDEVHLEDQHASDLEKTLIWAAQQGAIRVDIIGVEGGAPDHALGAFAAVIAAPPELEIIMHLERQRVYRVMPNQPYEEMLDENDNLSVFALSGPVRCTMDGVAWPLGEELLTLGTRGLHNKALGGMASVLSDGPLILMVDR